MKVNPLRNGVQQGTEAGYAGENRRGYEKTEVTRIVL